MISLEINKEELRKKNFDEILEYTKKLIDDVRKFEGVTKAELVRMLAEKLDEAGYPKYEIGGVILERLGDRVTRAYVSSCLPEHLKRPAKVAAGKRTAEAVKAKKEALTNNGANGSATMMEEPTHGLEDDGGEYSETKRSLQRDELPDIQPEIASIDILPPIQAKQNTGDIQYSKEYVESLENQIKALKGELGFQDRQMQVKLLKMDKITLNRLYSTSMASKAYTMVLVDIGTNQVTNMYSDLDWKKQKIYPKDK